MDLATNALASALKNVSLFSRAILRKPLRAYQVQPAAAIIEAAIRPARRRDHHALPAPDR